jgi:flagellar hook-length control protein FliK
MTAASSSAGAPANQGTSAASSPIAAVIVLNNVADATPAAPITTGASAAIGEQSKARAPGSFLRAAGQNNQSTAATVAAGADATLDAASAPQVPGDNGAGSDPAKSGSAGLANAAPGTQSPANAQQAQIQASNTAFTAPQPDTSAQASIDLITARGAAASTTAADSSSNLQTASNVVKAASTDLPNLAISAAATVTTQAVTATAGAAAAAAVPISGLPITIAAHAQAGSNQFDIRLDPPELGRIDVQLTLDGNGQVTSHVTVDRPETLTLLQSQQPQLERAFEQAGLKTADNGLQFTLRDQSFAGQNGGNGSGAQQNAAPQLVIPDADLAPVDTTQIYSRWNLGGGVDIRV